MKVALYSVHYNRPEFTILQIDKLKKLCKDDLEIVILNNARYDEDRQAIEKICLEKNVIHINFIQEERTRFNCTHDHVMALQYLYRNHVNINTLSDIRVVMDSDVIPYRSFSFGDILGDGDTAGMNLDGWYSAIFTVYSKRVDLSDFEIHAGMLDSGSGTRDLFRSGLYKCVGTPHTAPMVKREADYVFSRSKGRVHYQDQWGFQFIADCLIHYYRGTGWQNGGIEWHRAKMEFLMDFLDNVDLYNPKLDEYVCYELAHAEQHFPQYRLNNA